MKQNSTFTSFLVYVIVALLFTIASLLTSCTSERYSYFNKQKVPYTAPQETKFAKAIPAKPFLQQAENEVKKKVSSVTEKSGNPDIVQKDDAQKKEPSTVKLEQIFNEINIAKYAPKQLKGIQSENNSPEVDRDLMIVILVVLILILIALLGDDLIWLLFVALLILLIYILIKYLGVFN